MLVKSFILSIFLLEIISVIKSEENNSNSISVTIKNGKINGKTENFDDKEVNVFLGIPYAEPPIGDLRFKKPLPVKEWSEPIDATKWSSPCQQTQRHKGFLNDNFSEDCLHLNIWSPLISDSSDELKPVIFYIHGGALLYGSSNQEFHNPIVLSVKGDVVVVTINYRLKKFFSQTINLFFIYLFFFYKICNFFYLF
jgi:carboxylesterase type B